jgi:hypothetical protein
MILGLLAAATVVTDIAHLDWLAGTWVQVKPGATVREMWLPPQDGAMAGLTLTTRSGKRPVAEYAKITVEDQGLTFTAIVDGQPPTPFVLKKGRQADEALFENLAHDFPQRVIYRRCGPDLCARIEGVVGGKPQAVDWRYSRLKP